jgi:Ca2+-transporting ATPase
MAVAWWKASILTTETFENRTVNITALVEIALALLIARGGTLADLLSAPALTDTQWLLGAAPAVLLFIVWELGKAIARSRHPHVAQDRDQPAAQPTAGTEPAQA